MAKISKNKIKLEEVEIFNLLNQIDKKDDRKIALIYGKKAQKKSKTVSSFIKYKKISSEFDESLMDLKAGTDKKIFNDISFLIKKNSIPENLTSIDKKKYSNFFKNLYKKNLVSKCKQDFSKITDSKLKKDKYEENSKLTGPILNTVSAFGISLGVPLLSLALFRSQEIVSSLSPYFFYILVGVCVLLVLMAMTTTVYFLILSIVNNKKTMIVSKLDKVLESFILKWFNLDSKVVEKLSDSKKEIYNKKKHKFDITTFYNFFYNEIDVENDDYEYKTSLIKLVFYLNNNVFFIASFNQNNFDIKALSKSFPNEYIYLFDVSKYKTRQNYNSLILSILENISKASQINSKQLFLKNQLFANNIRFFLDKSDSNYDLFRLFNNTIETLSMSSDYSNNTKLVDYIVLIFSFVIFMTLEHELFLNLVYDISAKFSCSCLENNLFKNLRIENSLIKNLLTYGEHSVLFNIQYIFEEKKLLQVFDNFVELKKENLDFSIIEESIVKRGFLLDDKFDDVHFDFLYSNTYAESLLVKKFDEKNYDKFFEEIDLIKSFASEKEAKYICIAFESKAIFFQNNLGVYEVLEDFFF